MIFLFNFSCHVFHKNGADKNTCYANFQQRSFLNTFTMYVSLIRCISWDIHIFFKLLEVMTSFSWIIDEILTFLGKFSYLLNRLTYEVVRPLILIRKHNLKGVFILQYIILRSGSGLKLPFLAKMAILG